MFSRGLDSRSTSLTKQTAVVSTMTNRTNTARGLAREEAKLQHRLEGPNYLYLVERERRRWLTPEEHQCVLELAIAQAVRA